MGASLHFMNTARTDARLALRLAPCLAALAAAGCASPSGPAAFIDSPVVASMVVPASQYPGRMQPVATGGTPVEAALQVAGAFEGLRQVILQTNDTPESPSASRIVILRDGLLDDAVGAERWEVALVRTPAGTWAVTEARRAWRCRRGAAPAQFDVLPCP